MTARELVDMVGRRGKVSPRAYAIMLVLARGWLIERARVKRLLKAKGALLSDMVLHAGCDSIASCVEDLCGTCCDCGMEVHCTTMQAGGSE